MGCWGGGLRLAKVSLGLHMRPLSSTVVGYSVMGGDLGFTNLPPTSTHRHKKRRKSLGTVSCMSRFSMGDL